MNNLPEISVIVPVYKVEKYLPQCIDSILAQTFTDFELLLVDTGALTVVGRFVKSMPGRIRGYGFSIRPMQD
jgi:cellulose synthase/poly-beta-1,6-N-acetylglucosamine synthase-like glycosyltransferase